MEAIGKSNNYIRYKDRLDNIEYFIDVSAMINGTVSVNVKFDTGLLNGRGNDCFVSVNKDLSEQVIGNVIMKAYAELQKLGLKNFNNQILFIGNNEEELKKAASVINVVGLKGNYVKGPSYQENKTKEERPEKIFDKFLQANTVTKVDNGISRSFVERKADNNGLGYLVENITNVDLYRKLVELQNDPVAKARISEMNYIELSNFVLDSIVVSENRKRYLLESTLSQSNQDTRGAVAGEVAFQNEGTVNKEVGIVRNGANQTTEMKVVEEKNDAVRVVEPQMNKVIASSNNVSQTGIKNSNSAVSDDYSSKLEETRNLFGSEDINKVLEEEVQSREMERGRARKRVRAVKKSSGKISLPIILFVLAGLLLLASAIIWIVM